MINEKRLVNKFIEYVKVDSESFKEKEFCELIVSELKDLGFEVETDYEGEKFGSNGTNIYGFFKGNKNVESILFSGHLDTVQPGIGIDPVIENGVITSKTQTILGGDDKSGIVAFVEAMKVIKENKLECGPVEVVFTICEERGLLGSKNFDSSKIKSKQAMVLDSSGDVGKIIVQAPAQNTMKFVVKGRSAHAGIAPENGISAIMVASQAINNMKLLRIDEETTANIGMINGGVATNIVCDEVEVIAETRSLDNHKLEVQTNHMIECFKNACERNGASLEYEVTNNYSAYNLDTSENIVQLAIKAFDKLSMKHKATSTGGGSDANIFNEKGIKVINVATGMENVHTLSESIKVQSLIDISKFVLEVILMNE